MPAPRAPVDAIELAEGLTREYLLYHRLCPLERGTTGNLRIAVAPGAFLEDAMPDLERAYRCPVVPTEVSDADVVRLIERLVARVDHEAASIELARVTVNGDVDDRTADVRDLANQPPVVRYVNLLVRDAYDAGASDIHLEATKDGLLARLRLDGVLTPPPNRRQASPTLSYHASNSWRSSILPSVGAHKTAASAYGSKHESSTFASPLSLRYSAKALSSGSSIAADAPSALAGSGCPAASTTA